MDDDDFDVETSSMKFMAVDILPLILGFTENVLGALHSTAITAYNVAARHANFKHEQAVFREEAAIEIETLTGEVDG